MKKYTLALIVSVLYCLGYAQHNDSLLKVTDRLYMITGHGGNISFLETEEGVLVVDAGSLERDGNIIEGHIKKVTDKPVKYLVFTHYHYDHTLGACGFKSNPIIIAHENGVKNLQIFGQGYLSNYRDNGLKNKVSFLKDQMDSLKSANNPEWKEFETRYTYHSEELENLEKTLIVYPDITFKDRMVIVLGSDTINLIYPGNTHTDCNILVEFKNQKALATGDFFFHKKMPYIDYKANCDTENWIKQATKFAEEDYSYILPGHGPLAATNDLLGQATYLTDLRKEVIVRMKKDKSLEEIKNEVKMEKYSDYDFQFMISYEVEAVYNEIMNKR